MLEKIEHHQLSHLTFVSTMGGAVLVLANGFGMVDEALSSHFLVNHGCCGTHMHFWRVMIPGKQSTTAALLNHAHFSTTQPLLHSVDMFLAFSGSHLR
jgi:hypothetical protein